MRLSVDRWWRGAAAVGCGALPALAFPAPSLWWLAYLALVPWLLLLRAAAGGRNAAWYGWLGGTGFLLAMHHWLVPNLHVFLLVLAALLGVLWAPWGWLVWRLLAGSPPAGQVLVAMALLPSVWLLAELVRSWEYLGGPWGLLGASQWQVPPALRLASWGGVWLVSFLLVAVNLALATLITAPRGRIAAGCALAVGVSAAAAAWVWTPLPERTGTARVALVQPGITPSASVRFDRGEELTRGLAGQEVDLVVWAESSVGYDLSARPDLAARLAALSRKVGAPVLVNVDARRVGGPGIFKSSVLVGERGLTGDRYDKMRLVPFGEYVPARSVLGWVTSVGPAAEEDRHRGTEQVVMDADGLRIGPLVCLETAFPDMSRHLVRDGAQLLVAQSATSTFQESWAPQQHASLAALRAAESGRPMAHSTLTGITAVFGPHGEPVGEQLGTDRSTARVYPVPLASGSSPYIRIGDWVVYVALAVVAVFGALALSRLVRARK
ncbi:apolipoprotein N-acyltransferase [Streptomyces gobiensis]|uniref:apolipoprotein N-acyltransferase n=1 Tax=Streptomyces gobiensis TaxID=2875706 RepID=UPI001E331219|nr:apolipoprotein N-acyltransferase [Streptomyces gobiensis]UGY94827.1 apolipoprotein N-acyltransferase [Streptomyces gobiensis]